MGISFFCIQKEPERILCSDSVCNEGLKKMQALTRAKRQNKKPGSERELAPGPAWSE